MMLALIEFGVCMAIMVIAGCRLNMLHPRVTRPAVAGQFFSLGFGAFCSALLSLMESHIAVLPLAVGACGFLMLSADRWREKAPDDTSRPMSLDEAA